MSESQKGQNKQSVMQILLKMFVSISTTGKKTLYFLGKVVRFTISESFLVVIYILVTSFISF